MCCINLALHKIFKREKGLEFGQNWKFFTKVVEALKLLLIDVRKRLNRCYM